MFALFFAYAGFAPEGAANDFLFSEKLEHAVIWLGEEEAQNMLMRHDPHEYDCYDVVDVLLVGKEGQVSRSRYEWEVDYEAEYVDRKLRLKSVSEPKE